MTRYHFVIKTSIKASREEALKLVRDEPRRYLELLDMNIDDSQTKQKPESGSGDFVVIEDMQLPLIPTITFKTSYQTIDDGILWRAWAPSDVYVENEIVIEEQSGGKSPSTSTLIESTTFSCPFYVYPFVRWQTVRAHHRNHKVIQQYFRDQHTSQSNGRRI